MKVNIEQVLQYDVVVAGGGPAGIAAAVSASRLGVKTALIERFGVLGGMMTSGHVQPVLGRTAPYTMYHEVCGLLNRGHEDVELITTRNGSEIHVDPEEAKRRLLELAVDSGADVYLQTAVVDVEKEEGKIKGLLVTSPGGPCIVEGKMFVDATGDGYVAYRGGAPFETGREGDGLRQPETLEFTVGGVDEAKAIACYGGSDPVMLPDGKKYSQLCREACEKGILPGNVSIVRLHRTFYPGERQVNATQANGCEVLEAKGILEAELELRRQIDLVVRFLKDFVPGYENCYVKASASTLGVRETRRFTGEYVLSDQDVETGARFPDVVVHNAWFLIDIHNPKGGGQAEGHSKPAVPYDIPLRSLIPKNLDGVFLAGRNISGTHRAHGSYRVMGIALATGQAAGTAAAICAMDGIGTGGLDYRKVQKALMDSGAELFDKGECIE